MTPGAIPIATTDLAIAASLVLVAGGISTLFRLDLEKRLLIASVRTIVQLLLIGHALRWVFGLNDPIVLIIVTTLMIAAAGRAAVTRPSRTYSGAFSRAFVSLVLTGFVTTFAVTELIIGVDPWYRPQYVIPLLGMVLGNGLTGISLSVDHLLETLDDRRAQVEMELAHGASRWEAVRGPLADAVKRGMIPIINSMMVVGIVALPGMMTGQILAGADPLEAVKYQIVVMFMLAAATSLGCICVAFLTFKRLFNDRHQLLTDAIVRKPQ